jgi:adenylate cyclase
MAQSNVNLVIVFADVSGSTKLYEQHGDAVARGVIARCLDVLKTIVERHQGRVIKFIGDEIMCTFSAVDAAGTAVCDMQEAIADLRTDDITPVKLTLAIRVGMHFGPAILENNDVFGDAVNVAARMAGQAKAGQIITTQATYERMGAILKASSRLIARENVKGKKDAIELYELLWLQDDATRMQTGILQHQTNRDAGRLLLVCGDQRVELPGDVSKAVLGRSASAEVTVDETLASRQHASVEYRKGKFFLIDQSLNGTYVLHADSSESFIRREMSLTGQGKISLGRPFREKPVNVVDFSIDA